MKFILLNLFFLVQTNAFANVYPCGPYGKTCQTGREYCLVTGRSDNPKAIATVDCNPLPTVFKNNCESLIQDAKSLFNPDVVNCSQSVSCNIRGQNIQVQCLFLK